MIRWPQRTRKNSSRVPSVATDQKQPINEHCIVNRIIKGLGLFGKLESTVACFSTDVHFCMAFGAFLLVPVLWLLFSPEILLCFCFFFCLEPLCTRCIGLYHAALRMDAIRRVGSLATDNADLCVLLTKDWSRFFITHVLQKPTV